MSKSAINKCIWPLAWLLTILALALAAFGFLIVGRLTIQLWHHVAEVLQTEIASFEIFAWLTGFVSLLALAAGIACWRAQPVRRDSAVILWLLSFALAVRGSGIIGLEFPPLTWSDVILYGVLVAMFGVMVRVRRGASQKGADIIDTSFSANRDGSIRYLETVRGYPLSKRERELVYQNHEMLDVLIDQAQRMISYRPPE